MTDKVQKIREEVERLQDACMDEEGNIMTAQKQGAYDVLCKLDAFINSSQEEPTNEDLNKEIDKYLENLIDKEAEKNVFDKDAYYLLSREDLVDMASYFANWQQQQDQSL